MKPILFLDIDGVLNSREFLKREGLSQVDLITVRRLNRIVDVTKAEVVISSSWRTFADTNTPEKIERFLDENGFSGSVSGMTPVLGCEEHIKRGWERCHDAHRGHEIAAYLKKRFQDTDYPSFVILDDDSDMNPFMDRLVQTSFEDGLQAYHAGKAIDMLKKHRTFKPR
jgi:hypothetical protein